MDLIPVILSGGSGTRLWPLSREHYPKQLLPLYEQDTLLQATARRLEGLALQDTLAPSSPGPAPTVKAPLVVCNEEHRFLVAEQLRQVGCAASRIVLEPVGRNTAPALTVAALAVLSDYEDGVMLVMPADHVIKEQQVFQEAIRSAYAAAQAGALVTFGVVPTKAETGYGYMKRGAAYPLQVGREACDAGRLVAFIEKPDAATAEHYLASGEYYWNSGMFILRASDWMSAIAKYRPDIDRACRAAFQRGESDRDFFRLDKESFSACPSDSIDYAVMEKVTQDSASNAVLIPLDAKWSDVGAWPALWEICEHDAQGNVIKGDVYAYHTKNSLVFSEYRLVATIGLEDVIVIETADAVLVASKSHAQQIKDVVVRLKHDERTQHQTHRRVYRPWGSYEGIDHGERFQVKRITVNPNASLSLQMHHHRAEHWIVVRGTARVTRGEEVFLLTENQSTYIPLGVKHRLENPGRVPLELIEVQSGSYLGENDIVRFEDVYGRKS
jgi:mannose-1-phosphate guanylyltransferase/mannose-6-phosphate isomerase